MENINIKGIIFDYGGTIDSRGDHWSEVIWRGYQKESVPVTKEQFREAYVYAERELARVRHILPTHNFYDLLLIKMQIEFGNLVENGTLPKGSVERYAKAVAEYCYGEARSSIEEARPTLDALKAQYPMVLVSNFYGNVETVLRDFDLLRYFDKIIESAVVGIRKPDPRIFQLGVDALQLPASEVLVIGDSLRKDIEPAESIGCKAVWIKGKGWTVAEDEATHPNIIHKLSEVLAYVGV